MGCKFDRHIAKAFNVEEEEVFNAFMQASRKNEVCKCCKEIGHSAERCDNDPNFHTTKSNLEEMEL
jgi:ATP-dependent DNA ligase